MDRDRIDLSLLHPARDRERWERLVVGIVSRARVAALPPPVRHPLLLVADWAWPTLAAAAAVAGLSLVALSGGRAAGAGSTGALTVAEALEVPRPAADWLVEDRSPADYDLLMALDDLARPGAGVP